jgi:hypothetical protein
MPLAAHRRSHGARRPVITSSVYTDEGLARFHLDALGTKGLYYTDHDSLVRLLTTFDKGAAAQGDWNCYRAFEPARAMQTFKRIFLGDVSSPTPPAVEQ